MDDTFTFSCASSCSAVNCKPPQNGPQTVVNLGAMQLTSHILVQQPPGNIILVGYSLGGLIARDLIANNYLQVIGPMHQVAGLITLGAPNLGYPWSSADEIVFCKQLVDDMSGSWLPQQTKPALSPYLSTLNTQWQSAPFYPGYWLAAAGESCSNPTRNTSAQPGCLPSISSDPNSPLSDGIVCRDSAANYSPSVTLGPAPTSLFEDPQHVYVHSTALSGWGTALVLCGNNSTSNPTPLVAPPPNGLLFPQIEAVINAH